MKNCVVKSEIYSDDNHDEKYMKIKLNSDDVLPLNQMIESPC